MKFRKQKPGEALNEYKTRMKQGIKQAFKDGKLSKEDISMCEANGIDFRDKSIRDDEIWMGRFEAAKNKYFNFKQSESGWRWVSVQSALRVKGKLADWKIELLDENGFIWDRFKKKFYDGLEKFKNNNDGNKDWVQHQRTAFKKGVLSKWKIEELNKVGFDFNQKWNANKFEKRLKDLVEFRNNNGRDPNSYKCDDAYEVSLGNWRRNNRLKFPEAGVVYAYTNPRLLLFKKGLDKLKKFRIDNNKNPSSRSKSQTERRLDRWRRHHKDKLTTLRLYDFGDMRMGAKSSTLNARFDMRLDELIEFRINNNKNPSSRSKDGVERSLGRWRSHHRDRLEKLELYEI